MRPRKGQQVDREDSVRTRQWVPGSTGGTVQAAWRDRMDDGAEHVAGESTAGEPAPGQTQDGEAA
jgi:hypothetical protein